MSLADLPPYDADGNLHVVVESPRGSMMKIALDPEREAFVVKHVLPHGLVYPFAWGFVAGTRAADGDPLDAMVVADVPTWPGLLVPSRPLGILRVRQRDTPRGAWTRNDRLLAIPGDDPELADVRALPRKLVAHLEEFFVRVGELKHAAVQVDGWSGPRAARTLVADGARRRRTTASS